MSTSLHDKCVLYMVTVLICLISWALLLSAVDFILRLPSLSLILPSSLFMQEKSLLITYDKLSNSISYPGICFPLPLNSFLILNSSISVKKLNDELCCSVKQTETLEKKETGSSLILPYPNLSTLLHFYWGLTLRTVLFSFKECFVFVFYLHNLLPH